MRGAFILVLVAIGGMQLAPRAGYAQNFREELTTAPQNVHRDESISLAGLTITRKGDGEDRPTVPSNFSPNLQCQNPEECPRFGSIPRQTDILMPEGDYEGKYTLGNWKQGTTEFANSVKDIQRIRYLNVCYLTDPAVCNAMKHGEQMLKEEMEFNLSSRQKTLEELRTRPQGENLIANLLGCEQKRMLEKKMTRDLAWRSCIGDSRDVGQQPDVTITGDPGEMVKPIDDPWAAQPTGGAGGGSSSQDDKVSLWNLIFSKEIDAQACDRVAGDQRQFCQQVAETNKKQLESNIRFFGDIVYSQVPSQENPNVMQAWVERKDPWYDANQSIPGLQLKKKVNGIELEYLLNALDSAQALMWLMHEACISFNKNAPESQTHEPFSENNFGNAGNLFQTLLGAIGINFSSGGSSLGSVMPLGQEGLLCGGLDSNDASVKKAFAKLSTSRFTYSCEHAKVNFFEFFKHQVRTGLYKGNSGRDRLKCSLIEPTAQKVIEMYRKSLDPKDAKDVLRFIRKSWFKHADEVAMFRIFEMIDIAEEKLGLLSTCQQLTPLCQDAFRLIQQKRGKITPEVIQEGLRDAYADKIQQKERTSEERSGGISQMKPGEPRSSSGTR